MGKICASILSWKVFSSAHALGMKSCCKQILVYFYNINFSNPMTFSLEVFLLLSQFNELTPLNCCTLRFVIWYRICFWSLLISLWPHCGFELFSNILKSLLVIGHYSLFHPFSKWTGVLNLWSEQLTVNTLKILDIIPPWFLFIYVLASKVILIDSMALKVYFCK